MQEDFMLEYNLFKIPQCSTQTTQGRKQTVVGLIDASGSMSSYWQAMVKFWNQTIADQCEFLITFSHNAKLEENSILSEDLRKHGGGMTNINAAFEKMQERLQIVQKDVSLTVVFISDGQDTVSGEKKIFDKLKTLKGSQGRSINFICLGIQSGFPTNLAMKLRELYHTGDQSIPAVYLIEYASEKAFFNKFQTMNNCFKAAKKIKIPNAGDFIKNYPWQKPGNVDFQQGRWIMVHKQFPKVQVVYTETQKSTFQVTTLDNLSIEDLVDCFRGWVQKVQLLSMDNKKIAETQKIAKNTADQMKANVLEFEKFHKIDLISDYKGFGKDSFKKRTANLMAKNVGHRIKWFIEQLYVISKGVGIGQLNEYEAAKRIGIGTITGRYHQKALALKGITLKDFEKIKEQFIEVFKQTELSKEPSKQEPSIFTLQNQKELFQEPDFIEGLDFCKSQFDLVETFPVVGYGLKVKRYDGSMLNPWKVQVLQLAKTHKTIDSMYLARNNNKYELSIGQDQVEQINAVLPVFDLNDKDLAPLLNTRLFKLAISFMVVQNIDTYHEEAYMALLGSTFLFLLNQKKTQWRDSLIDSIYTSMKATYGALQTFQKLIKEIQQNPFVLFTAKGEEDHVDITKVFLLLFYILKQGRLSTEKAKHFGDLALVHYAEKTYVENQFKIFKVIDVKVDEEKQLKIFKGEQENKEIKGINLLKDHESLKSIVNQQLANVIDIGNLKLTISDKIFLHKDEEKRVCYPQINSFFELFNGRQLLDKQMLYYFGHYLKGKNQENYNNPVSKNEQQLEKSLTSKVDFTDLFKVQGKQIKKIRKHVENKLLGHFMDTHFGILPMAKEEIAEQCQKRAIDFKKLEINSNTGMIKNACMSSRCLYFLKPMKPKEMQEHMKLWHKHLPPRFHMTVVNMLKNKEAPEKICDLMLKSGIVNTKKHQKDKEFVLDYIIKIAKSMP